MRFLIQSIGGKIVHDFTFTLLESIKYQKWLGNDAVMHLCDDMPSTSFHKKPLKNYVPVGSVEFVSDFIFYCYGITVKPINVPECLFHFANRNIFNGKDHDVPYGMFFKSNDKIKGSSGILERGISSELVIGNYQISDIINIDSEYRTFVFKNEIVGIQNYSGDFKIFPCIKTINKMIANYENQPIAYTLDVGINEEKDETFIIEIHDFFSCGLYGFSDHQIYPYMLSNWFNEYITINRI